MPSLLDFLLAPWKILAYLGGPPAASKVAASGVGPQGAFCSTLKVGDDILSVCRIFGYEMPSFVFYACLLIFALFAVSSIALLFQCGRVATSLARIESVLKAQKSLTLETVRSTLSKEPITKPSWLSFEQTLIPGEKANDSFSTVAVDAVLSKERLIEDHVHISFFNTIPGILTGVGLLMTFVAILDGLSHVTVTETMDVKGIGGLINGLSGKFASSITAVSCAVAFVFVERVAYNGPQKAYRKLVELLTTRFPRRTTEHLLVQIQKELVELHSRLER